MAEAPKKYTIEIDEAALRDLKKLPKQVQTQIMDAIKELTYNPRPVGVESLTKFIRAYFVFVPVTIE